MILTINASLKAPWLSEVNPNEFEDSDFIDIINFYLFNTPCIELSARGISFNDYGWTAPNEPPWQLTNHIKRVFEKTNYCSCCDTYEKLCTELINVGWIDNFGKAIQEQAIFYKNKKSEIVAYNLFYHIRNSFAHGRFRSLNHEGTIFFILEDVCKISIKKERYNELTLDGINSSEYNSDFRMVTARMILKKSTLLSWIDIIKGGEKEFSSLTSNKKSEKKAKELVLSAN